MRILVIITVFAFMGCLPKAAEVVSLAELTPSAQPISVTPEQQTAWVNGSARVLGTGFVAGARVEVGGVLVESRVDDVNNLRIMVPSLAPGSYDLVITNPNSAPAVLRGGFGVSQGSVSACDRVTISFADTVTLIDTNGQAVLGQNLACFDARGDTLLVEGFSSNELTIESALAASYQRAAVVASQIIEAGADEKQLRLIAYGREGVVRDPDLAPASVLVQGGVDYPARAIPASQVYGLPFDRSE